jgi:hypothetical protein
VYDADERRADGKRTLHITLGEINYIFTVIGYFKAHEKFSLLSQGFFSVADEVRCFIIPTKTGGPLSTPISPQTAC